MVPQTLAPPVGATADPIVQVTPTSGLTDAQAVTINVQGTADTPVNEADVHLCRAGAVYATGSSSGPARDFDTGGPNCPRKPVSSSADLEVDDSDGANFSQPGGDTFLFRVGSGVTTWTDNSGNDQKLTCDPDNQCALVVELFVGAGSNVTWRPHTFALSYAKDDPFAGCGGPAQGVLATGGSDRMIDAWVAWTRAECQRPGRSGSATRASFTGEGNSVSGFASGDIDLAYTAGGYDAGMGLARAPDGSALVGGRASVAVPLALNATVLAVAGGQKLVGHNVPFKDIKLNLDEAATMISGGSTSMSPLEPAIRARNPELAELFNTHAGGFSGGLVGAYADAEASTWYATRWLKTLAPGSWKVPDSPTFGKDRGRDRGIDNAFATADPSYANALSLLSGRPVLGKGLANVSFEGSGVWALTDLATAKALSITAVQIQNSRGDFVAPTPESLLAALPTMKQDDQGVAIADPAATAAAGAQQPYPMTMVEYALVPAEPLVDQTSCTANAGSQALLKGWLDYVTGDGQAVLPAGMVALPPDLRTTAQAAIAKVGAAPVTGSCAGKVTDPAPGSPLAPSAAPAAGGGSPAATGTPNGDLPGGGVVGAGSSGSGLSAGGSAAGSPAAANGTPATAVIAAATAAAKPASSVGIPGFGGTGFVSWVITVLALLGIVAVTSVASLASSGRLVGVRNRFRLKR